ncbi:MAG: DNA internalization-related competence protein ComEC/Rec2 [Steroidobacteraceae bacterium]|nr:DNA internalization-related competence protein ComEC/Rec2 [Steroidobacteraceae bacterium]
MFVCVLAFCAGAASLQILPALAPAVLLPPCLAAAVVLRRRAPASAAACCGLAWAALLVSAQLARDWPCDRDREAVTLTGVIAAPAVVRDHRTDFDLDVVGPQRLKARISWYDATATPKAGERWTLGARLRCRRGFVNPGTADRELALLRQGIGATGYALASPPPQRGRHPAAERRVERLREQVASGISAALPAGPSVAVLQGLAVGVRGSMPDELWEAFAATGTAHLMAISGVHVTGCALFALWLLRLSRRLPPIRSLPHWLAAESAIVVAVTAGYAWLSGASPPALRTLAMVAIAAGLRLARRNFQVHETLAIAALCLIAADPLTVTSAGFWLSFVATATLIAAAQAGTGLSGRLAGFVRAQAAILATLAPVLAAAFGRISLIAPAANAVAIPFFGLLLLPAVLLGTALELAAPGAAAAVWRALAALLDPLWPALVAMGRWPWADWSPAAQPGPLLLAAGVATFVALCLPLAGLRAAAAAMLLAIAAGAPARHDAGGWTLTVLDVGQGLAAVVETEAHVLVFDTGPRWRGGGTAADVSLLPWLRARGIRRIDRLIVSHPDQDHAGGAPALMAAFAVADSSPCLRGAGWQWDGIAFRILHPPAGLAAGDNDLSCALEVRGGGGSALLLADPERRAEEMLLEETAAADVVLLPHHGSRSSSSPALVARIGARLGIASAGYRNRWGMPDAGVVARWRASGTTVLSTADAGAISVRFAGSSLQVATARGEPRWWRPGGAS